MAGESVLINNRSYSTNMKKVKWPVTNSMFNKCHWQFENEHQRLEFVKLQAGNGHQLS